MSVATLRPLATVWVAILVYQILPSGGAAARSAAAPASPVSLSQSLSTPLGNTAEFAATSRYSLQEQARALLLGHDIASLRRRSSARESAVSLYERECGLGSAAATLAKPLPLAHRLIYCHRAARAAGNGIPIHGDDKTTWYADLQTCGSPWACPVCAHRIAEVRRQELKAALTSWRDRSGAVLLVTFTAQHHLSTPLKPLLSALLSAVRLMRSYRAYKDLRRQYGVVGTVRALEITHGANGWHPHLHELWFASDEPSNLALRAALSALWLRALDACGLSGLDAYAVDVRSASWSVDEYVTKFGKDRSWDLDAELTQGVRKRGRVGGRSAFDLLRLADGASDVGVAEQAGALYREFVVATYGRHQLQWSRGLRATLGLAVDAPSDEQIAAGAGDLAVPPVVVVEPSDFARVVAAGRRAELLLAVRDGGAGVVRGFVDSLTPLARAVSRSLVGYRRGRVYDPFDYDMMMTDLMVNAAG